MELRLIIKLVDHVEQEEEEIVCHDWFVQLQ